MTLQPNLIHPSNLVHLHYRHMEHNGKQCLTSNKTIQEVVMTELMQIRVRSKENNIKVSLSNMMMTLHILLRIKHNNKEIPNRKKITLCHRNLLNLLPNVCHSITVKIMANNHRGSLIIQHLKQI